MSNDPEIRNALLHFISRNKQGDVFHELTIAGGHARADVVTINNSAITGYEIKSARDSFTRLENQIHYYSLSCDHTYLVIDRRHLTKLNTINIPPHIGIYTYSENNGITKIKSALKSPSVSSYYQSFFLWKDEALSLFHEVDNALSGLAWKYLAEVIEDKVPKKKLISHIRKCLSTRHLTNVI